MKFCPECEAQMQKNRSKGGRVRNKRLSVARRRAIARKASRARWDRVREARA